MYSPRVTFFLQWNTKEDILKNGDNQTVLMTDTISHMGHSTEWVTFA